MTQRLQASKWSIALCLIVLMVGAVVFLNALTGDFVYDDNRQVVQNYYIQDAQQFFKALSSDVWGFAGSGTEARSNYWRPSFVLWLMANYRLFGAGNPVGWHVTNLLLHLLTIAVAFGFLRYLGLSAWLTAAITLLFAVHPVHVETVSWISGSPDLLLAPAFLGALWLLLAAYPAGAVIPPTTRSRRQRRQAMAVQQAPGRTRKLVAAGLLAAVAMGAKEVGIVFPLVAYVAILASHYNPRLPWSRQLAQAAVKTWPYFLLAVVYFILRAAVLGNVAQARTAGGPLEIILTAPAVFTFYIRQVLFPYWLGPLYPLALTRPGNLSATNFLLPLLLTAGILTLAYLLARQGRIQQIGLALFFFPLLPAFNVIVFTPDQLVHDRYLYLPLLGFLMAVIPSLASLLETRRHWSAQRTGQYLCGAAALLALPLALQTTRYNTAWQSNLSLWEWATTLHPESYFGWSQYGFALEAAGRTTEAQAALAQAVNYAQASNEQISSTTLITSAQVAISQQRYADAEALLLQAAQMDPANVLAIELLAQVYQATGNLDNAVTLLTAARQNLPHYHCGFTTNLAVAYYLRGQPDQTLAELEAVRPMAETESDPQCRLALFYLAQLYGELGQADQAQATYERYLQLTQGYSDEASLKYRAIASEALQTP